MFSGCAFGLLGAVVADWLVNWRSIKDSIVVAGILWIAPKVDLVCPNDCLNKWCKKDISITPNALQLVRFVFVVCFGLLSVIDEQNRNTSVVTHVAGLLYGFLLGLMVKNGK